MDAAGRNMVSAEYAEVEGIAFLSSWLRRSNLERVLRINLGSSFAAIDAPVAIDGISLRAFPRGVVCHWVAGNIPTLAFFSWALATLGKNASILRVPEESREVVRNLFRAVERASFEFQGRKYEGSLLLERCRVVYFPSSDLNLNESMSLVADARVAGAATKPSVRLLRIPGSNIARTWYSAPNILWALLIMPPCRTRCTIGGAGSFCPSGDHV